MTKTYSEQRQAIYFKAARDMWRVAAQVLDDSAWNEADALSVESLKWVITTSRKHADQAKELERQGRDCCIVDHRAETALYRAKNVHSDAINQFEKRVVEHDGAGQLKLAHSDLKREAQLKRKAVA